MDFASIDTSLSHVIAQRKTDLSRADSLRLSEVDVYGLLAILGLTPCPAVTWDGGASESARHAWAQRAVALADEQKRILLKVVGREILHKTDVGGVRVLRWQDGAEAVPTVLAAVAQMLGKFREAGMADAVEGVMAAAFVPHQANQPGQEVLLSLRQDPAFGPCVVVGVGGTLTEWYGQGGGAGCPGGSTLIFAANLLAAMPKGEVDLIPTYCQHVPVRVIARLLGVPEEMGPDLLRWSSATNKFRTDLGSRRLMPDE